MPKDNIERAIKKGTGELEGGNVEEVLYEGYGPFGVAVMCDIMTDNRNRTAPELRKLFELHGGKLGGTGCVAYLFDRKGLVVVPADQVDEALISRYLYTAGLPDPDLIVRTSGEMRVSNFLIWQGAYAEYYVTPAMWPDFDRDEFYEALQAYGQRERRFGLVPR